MPIYNSTYLNSTSQLLVNYVRGHEDINTCVFRVSERTFEKNSLLVIKNSTTRKSLHFSFVHGNPGVKVTFTTSSPKTPEYIATPQVENKVTELAMKADLFTPEFIQEMLCFLYKSRHYPPSEKLEAVMSHSDITDDNVFACRIALVAAGEKNTSIFLDDGSCVQYPNEQLDKYKEILKPNSMFIENKKGVFAIRKHNQFMRSFIFKD